MGNSAEASRERIFEAAKAEFAAHGVAGARVDRIAAAAGLNKNLIYIYFGDKQALFNEVIQREAERLQEAAPLTSDDVEGYALAMFDYIQAHPELLRLALWSALENGPDRPLTERGAGNYRRKLDALAIARESGVAPKSLSAPALLAVLYAVSQMWSLGNPMGGGVTRMEPVSTEAKRAAVLTAVRAILGSA